VLEAPRIAAAALLGCVTAGLGVAALASAATEAPRADVTLQVAPRGPGSISTDPAGVDQDGQPVTEPCTANQGQGSCEWKFPAGREVRLIAKPDAGKSFFGWSTPDCPGAGGSCTVKLDQGYTSIVGTFAPLTLGVRFSEDDEGVSADKGEVTSDPAGIHCTEDGDDDCFAGFTPHQRVTLTAKPKPSHSFKGWNGACQPANAPTCTVGVDDQPTWAGAIWDDDDPPQIATTIEVRFQLQKSGNGSGRVTGSNIDCGGSCTRSFGFGRTITVTAAPDAGSTFQGWNGVCSKTQAACTFAVGPITSLRAVFARDTNPPSVPGGLHAVGTTRTTIALGWSASTDDVGVAGYRVYVADAMAGDTKDTTLTLTSLGCGRTYHVAVDAADAVGNRSAKATLDAQTSACALAARLAGLSVQRAGGTRVVVAKVRVNRPTTARLRLMRGSFAVASRSFAVVPGTNTLRLRVAKGVRPGAYRLRITLTNPDGGTMSLAPRGAYLPRPR